MPQILRPDGWVQYKYHRMATVDDWDSGETLRATTEPEYDAQYNPRLFHSDEVVETLERLAYERGLTITDIGHKEKRYFRLEGQIVGACSGEYTQFLFVECTSGFFHGRPISLKELRRLGVKNP